MRTDSITGWWTCLGCGEDVELSGPGPVGCEVPCPDCGDGMVLCWEASASDRSAA